MRVVVNVLPVVAGGGVQNARNLWKAIGSWGAGDEWMCVCRPGKGFEGLTTAPWQDTTTLDPAGVVARIRTENKEIPELARRWGADLIFTPMGAGPLRAHVPKVVGWHDSTAAYPDSDFWRRITWSQSTWIRLRQRYARRAARDAARVCVQTETMKARLGARWGIPAHRFVVVPNGPSGFLADEPPVPEAPVGQPWRVLVIGDPKPTKNLEMVPEVGRALAEMGRGDGVFAMTLTSDQGPFLRQFRRALARWGEEVPIERIGQVPHEALGRVYRTADAVFLPSLLESFSATYVEAMHFGVPLVTSHFDFAREICGPAAEYVDPMDPLDCARGLDRVLTDPARRQALREAGFLRVREFPDWKQRFDLYRDACRAAIETPRVEGALP